MAGGKPVLRETMDLIKDPRNWPAKFWPETPKATKKNQTEMGGTPQITIRRNTRGTSRLLSWSP